MSKALHLNLLRESERVSSSPIRLRIMLPVLAVLGCLGIVVWWGILTGRMLLLQSDVSTLERELATHKAEHTGILEKLTQCTELESEFEQLEGYRAGRRRWGETLSAIAEVMPLKVQLTRLEIPQPPPQDLTRPSVKGRPKVKGPPLWGPTGNVESVSLVLAGRAPKQAPILALMESLKTEAFTNALVTTRDPRVRSYRQETSARGDAPRLLTFELEYRARERRFAP